MSPEQQRFDRPSAGLFLSLVLTAFAFNVFVAHVVLTVS